MKGSYLHLVRMSSKNELLLGTGKTRRVIPLAHPGGRVFTQVGRGGWDGFIDELCGHQHDSHLGAKPSRLSTSEEPVIILIHYPYPLSSSIILIHYPHPLSLFIILIRIRKTEYYSG